LPSHAFEELPSSSALLNQKLGKFHSHSGKFTRIWKKSTPTVDNLPEVGKIGKFTKSWKNPTPKVEN